MLRYFFFGVLVRGVILIVLGLNLRRRHLLPKAGPAILAANHNSHLDTMVLMTLMPLSLLRKVRPVAAADYFLRNKLIAWFALDIIGILPIRRTREPGDDSLAPLAEALDRGEILIFFPEGTRGAPEQFKEFKTGIARLAERRPQVPIVPIYMHGLGKALPKGEALLVPFFVDVFVGEPVPWSGDRDAYMEEFKGRMVALSEEEDFSDWT